MFPKRHRLNPPEVKVVYSRGNRYHADYLIVYKLARGDTELTRYAVSVAKSAEKSAARRNRLKRLVREAVRSIIPMVCPGHNVVLSVTGRNAPRTLKGWKDSVHDLFLKAGLLCRTS